MHVPVHAVPHSLSPDDVARLQAALKRCSTETFQAACAFLATGDRSHLRPLIHGILERYVEFRLRHRLGGSPEQLRLSEDLGLDSLTLIEIVVLAEEVLGVSISNEEMTQLRTVSDVNAFIERKTMGKPEGKQQPPPR